MKPRLNKAVLRDAERGIPGPSYAYSLFYPCTCPGMSADNPIYSFFYIFFNFAIINVKLHE